MFTTLHGNLNQTDNPPEDLRDRSGESEPRLPVGEARLPIPLRSEPVSLLFRERGLSRSEDALRRFRGPESQPPPMLPDERRGLWSPLWPAPLSTHVKSTSTFLALNIL